jgi:hypothetical protein
MSRYNVNDARRNIFIPEIGSYVVTRNYIKNENILQELIEFSETSDVSFSFILGKNDSIMRHEQSYGEEPTEIEGLSSDYINNVAQKIIRSAGAKYVLKLDISNCFSSFYMHMIPAIMLGVDSAEIEYKKYINNKRDTTLDHIYLKYSKLDAIIRHQNLNRTNGLLVGTLYSKIIAEAILVRIDKELCEKAINYSRYMDDYEVYISNEGEEKQVISTFEIILKRYGFSLNSEKTELVGFPYYAVSNLEKIFQRNFESDLDNAEIMEIFNSFFSLEESGIKGSIRYLLKTIEKYPITTADPELYKSYLLTILTNNERSLTKACSLLINNQESLRLSEPNIILINKLLDSHLRYEHDLEVVWLLYLLIQTGNIVKGDNTTFVIAHSHNELAQLLLLRKELLSEESLSHMCAEATSWILLYELYAVGEINERDFAEKLGLNKNLRMYQNFKNNNLHFCVF